MPGVAAAAPAIDAVPIIFVHGIHADPDCWSIVFDQLGRGRAVVQEMYAAEADALQPGSLPPGAVVSFGYYKDRASDVKYVPDAQGMSHGSIGSCPAPRADGLDAFYTDSYADRLRRCVEGVKRATGSDRVDLVGHSMGGVVARAYVKWRSVGPNGRSSVRRLFIMASPNRGLNALEETFGALAETGPTEFCRLGECLEMSRDGTNWGGRAYMEVLNDDWDGFCARHDIRYAGMSLLGLWGAPPATGSLAAPVSSSSSSGNASGLTTGALLQVKSMLGTLTPAQLVELPLWPIALRNFATMSAEAVGPRDGMILYSSSRLDLPPFLNAAFFGRYEGAHANIADSERGFSCSYSVDCIRSFCLEHHDPVAKATCARVNLTPVDAPGRATFLVADVSVQGDGPLAIQVIEETMDAAGRSVIGKGYGAPLRRGDQRIAFVVDRGGGKRRYTVFVYGESGPIATRTDLVFALTDGALESAPLATIAPTASSAAAHLALGSNAAPSDASLRWRVRFDLGPWSGPIATPSFDTPPLAPGLHRVEVVCESSSNAAGVHVEQALPSAVGIVVDAQGVRFLR